MLNDPRIDYPETLEEFKKLDSVKSDLINRLSKEITELHIQDTRKTNEINLLTQEVNQMRKAPSDWVNNQNGFICVHRSDGELCVYIPTVIGKQETFCLPDGRTLTITVSEQITQGVIE